MGLRTRNAVQESQANGVDGFIPADELDLTPTDPTNTGVASKSYPWDIVWRNVILMSLLHMGALYGLILIPQAKWSTILWALVMHWMAGQGITAGAHRLWAHRSYKAKTPLRILLAIFNSMAFQNDVIEWARDHRVHHKYSETDADPHNAKRGFFFSHVGWLLVRKHPEVKDKGKLLHIDDLLQDPVLQFQRKYYVPSVILLCFIIPTLVPVYLFGESFVISYFVCALLRYCVTLNSTWLVNSAAHMWGWRPYDERINPAENPAVAFLAAGEGFHNYHHSFPQDYSTAEFGWLLNFTTLFVDVFAALGQVYDRKSMPKKFVDMKKEKTRQRMIAKVQN